MSFHETEEPSNQETSTMRKIIENKDRPFTTRSSDDRQARGARPLSLRRETLRELTLPELDSAVGGRMPSSRPTFI
jgi:hypothetical protein